MTSLSPHPKRLHARAELKRAKRAAHLAFLAHSAAIRDGDKPASDAASRRFSAASKTLLNSRTR